MKKILSLLFLLPSLLNAQHKLLIHYNSNDFKIPASSEATFDSLAIQLKTMTDYSIVVRSFCDSSGNEVNNRILAENRANTAVAALKARGIQNISAASFSASMPVAANSTPEGRARNRRTELIIKYSAAEPVVKKEIEKPEETIVEQPAAAQDLDLNKLDEQLRPGALLRLKDLNFVGGTSVLMREAEPSMKILLQVMQEHPTLKISVEGHVCCANDYMLSRERALKVYLYLTKNGIDETRLSYKAFSNSVPIASEATEDGRTKNRRVEIRIKSI